MLKLVLKTLALVVIGLGVSASGMKTYDEGDIFVTVEHQIMLLGDTGVGKSSMCAAFLAEDDDHIKDVHTTVAVAFDKKKDVYIMDMEGDLQQSDLVIYDTSGHMKFLPVYEQFVEVCHGFLVVFDVSNANSLDNVLQLWYPQISSAVEAGASLVLVGNKNDKGEDAREVTIEEARALARQLKAKYVETSALSTASTRPAFVTLLKSMLAKSKPQRRHIIGEPASEGVKVIDASCYYCGSARNPDTNERVGLWPCSLL